MLSARLLCISVVCNGFPSVHPARYLRIRVRDLRFNLRHNRFMTCPFVSSSLSGSCSYLVLPALLILGRRPYPHSLSNLTHPCSFDASRWQILCVYDGISCPFNFFACCSCIVVRARVVVMAFFFDSDPAMTSWSRNCGNDDKTCHPWTFHLHTADAHNRWAPAGVCEFLPYVASIPEGAQWASSGPAKSSLSWLFGRGATTSPQRKTSRHPRPAIVDIAFPECLNTTVFHRFPPHRRAFSPPSPVIFECSIPT